MCTNFQNGKKKANRKRKKKNPEKLADRYADTKSVRSYFFSLNFVNTEMSQFQTVINAIFSIKYKFTSKNMEGFLLTANVKII